MSRRNVRLQGVQSRAYRNMSALNRMSKRETYLRGIGQGLVFLTIGCVILGLNLQKVGDSSIVAAFQALPDWVWVVGGGFVSLGLCWTIRNIWLFATLARSNQQGPEDTNLSNKSTN